METQKKINTLFKQSNFLGTWWGNLQIVAQQTNLYIQIAIFSFSGIAAYGVLSEGLSERGYNIPFWAFATAVLFLGIVIILFVWKFAMHSTFASWNQQWWDHENPLRTEIKELHEKLDRIEKELKDANSKRVLG